MKVAEWLYALDDRVLGKDRFARGRQDTITVQRVPVLTMSWMTILGQGYAWCAMFSWPSWHTPNTDSEIVFVIALSTVAGSFGGLILRSAYGRWFPPVLIVLAFASGAMFWSREGTAWRSGMLLATFFVGLGVLFLRRRPLRHGSTQGAEAVDR